MATFKSYVNGAENGPFATFADAFADFFPRVVELMEHGCSFQVLETACRITGDFGGQTNLPMFFFGARDLAYDLGILEGNGEFKTPPPELHPQTVEATFRICAIRAMEGMSRELVACFSSTAALL
jgi:hypothetical protein